MMQQNRVSYIERRRFLCGMVSGGAAALGTVVVVPTVAFIRNRHVEPVPDFVVLSAADYDIAPGSCRIVRYGPRPLLMLRTPEPDSTLKIFQATCTHLDCIVTYAPKRARWSAPVTEVGSAWMARCSRDRRRVRWECVTTPCAVTSSSWLWSHRT